MELHSSIRPIFLVGQIIQHLNKCRSNNLEEFEGKKRKNNSISRSSGKA